MLLAPPHIPDLGSRMKGVATASMLMELVNSFAPQGLEASAWLNSPPEARLGPAEGSETLLQAPFSPTRLFRGPDRAEPAVDAACDSG